MPQVTPLQADDPVRVGRYRLTGRVTDLPHSGSAYLGRAPDGRPVMVSLLSGDWIEEAAERDRFTAEASAARRVAPLCAARILDAGFDAGGAFLVSEYVAGPSLRDLIADEGPWKGGYLEAVALGTATGLGAVHDAGLVHGEFGPEYVVVGPEGPRVIEFGISPPYGAATPSADMRAWAYTVLYVAAGGPADASDLRLLPEPLRDLAGRCLDEDPAQRPSARSVVAGLLGLGEPPPGVLTQGSSRAALAAWRHPRPAAGPPAPGARGRPRRAIAIWSFSIAACVVAAVVAVVLFVHVSQGAGNGGTPKPDATTSLTARKPTGRPHPSATVPAALGGSWSGQVTQIAPTDDVFTVGVDLASGASAGTVRYSGTSLSCAGNLAVLSASPGSLKLSQVITRGPCANGSIVLTVDPGGSVGFSFQGKQGPAANGTLRRV
jgi:eukaryotic-like serine/threonine-protein kinase